MKTHFFKRGIAGLLSLVMCLSAFIGLGTTTAFAAGEQAEVYSQLYGGNVLWAVYATVHFFCLCLRGGSGTLFPAQTLCRHGNRIVDVYFGSRTLCGSRLYQIQRNDGGKVRMGLVQIRVSDAFSRFCTTQLSLTKSTSFS